MSRIDKFLNSWVSKKLTVFVVATLLALASKVTGHDWANLAMVYIGTQGAIDLYKQIKSNRP